MNAARKFINDRRPYSPSNRATSNSMLQSIITNRENSPYSEIQRNLLNYSANQLINNNSALLSFSHSSKNISSPADDYKKRGLIIHYNQEQRNTSKKGGVHRVPVSNMDSFNQKLLREEVIANQDNVSTFFQSDVDVGIPAMLPKVHRDLSKKEFYYGRSKDPIKIAKSDVNLLDKSGRGDKSSDLMQKSNRSGILRAGQSGMIGHKMPRERDMVQGMKKNDSIIGQMKLKERELKEKKLRKILNEKIKSSTKKSAGYNSTKQNYLKQMLRDTSLTFIN